jgi:hypothetical protein
MIESLGGNDPAPEPLPEVGPLLPGNLALSSHCRHHGENWSIKRRLAPFLKRKSAARRTYFLSRICHYLTLGLQYHIESYHEGAAICAGLGSDRNCAI